MLISGSGTRCFLDGAEVGAQRFLFVRAISVKSIWSTEDSSALVRIELIGTPRPAIVDALHDSNRMVRSTSRAELQTDVCHLPMIENTAITRCSQHHDVEL